MVSFILLVDRWISFFFVGMNILSFLYLLNFSCIDFVIEELVKSYEKILEGKLIVIGSFRNKRSYMEFVKNKQMPFCVYGEMESLFDMNIEEEIPSMFLLNKNMEMRNVFYPMKEIPFMVNQYFKIINKQLKSE